MYGKITVVGLGSGNEDQLSLGVLKLLKNTKSLYLRTRVHPVTMFLDNENINYETFDFLYETHNQYEQVYSKIAFYLLQKALNGESLIYAVPGNPMVAEKSVQYLIGQGKEQNIEIDILGGESFIDTLFSRVNIDPIDGLLVLNGEEIKREDINPSKNIVICQVYNQYIASEIKLTLMELYPDDALIYTVSNLGIYEKEEIKQVPLFKLDRNKEDFHHLSSIYIPKALNKDLFDRDFFKLVELVKDLRSPNGCPWDRAQTHQSIRKNMIEEAYELIETIDTMDMNHMIEELGDVLLQVILHSQIAKEEGYFDIYDVLAELNKKLVRRHPHVFGNEKASKAEEAYTHWEKIKQKEKQDKGITITSALNGIPKDLPAINKAYKLQKKAANVGFDWTESKDIYNKIEEEFSEVKTADKVDLKGEIGDLLFAVINLARFFKIDPEEALSMTNRKFVKRFEYIEEQLKKRNILINDASLDLMELFWNEAKELNKRGDKIEN